MAGRAIRGHPPILVSRGVDLHPPAIDRKEAHKMRKLMAIGLLLLAGCQNTYGPFAARPPQRPDDPRYSVEEQKSRVNDQVGVPNDFDSQMPRSGNAIPGLGPQYNSR